MEKGWLGKEIAAAQKQLLASAIATVAPDAVIERATEDELAQAHARVKLEQAWLDDYLSH